MIAIFAVTVAPKFVYTSLQKTCVLLNNVIIINTNIINKNNKRLTMVMNLQNNIIK